MGKMYVHLPYLLSIRSSEIVTDEELTLHVFYELR